MFIITSTSSDRWTVSGVKLPDTFINNRFIIRTY